MLQRRLSDVDTFGCWSEALGFNGFLEAVQLATSMVLILTGFLDLPTIMVCTHNPTGQTKFTVSV